MAKQTYTITEYGSFARKKHLPNYVYLPEAVFDKLARFIRETAEKGEDVIDLMGISYRKNVGDVITAKNYVGVIALNDGNVVEILPKICGEENQAEVKKLLIKMLRTVQNSPFKSVQTTNVNADKLPLFEIFIRMFLAEAFSVVKRGLKSGYETVEENLSVCKGKMDFARQIKYNLIHKEHFCVRYDEFNPNRPENKLIKSTLKYLFKQSRSTRNKADLKVLLNALESIDESMDYASDFAKCIDDRQARHYHTILAWCKVFLQGKSFTSFAGSEVAYALLFPMETVFESYVAMQLKKQLSGTDYAVSSQHKGKYLFEDHKRFALRPDIVIQRKSDGAIFIMDTKWKRLINNPALNYGISQADMYQMYAYQKKYGPEAKSVTLLYPLTEGFPNNEIKYVSADGVTVHVSFVDLKHIEDLSKQLETFAVC